MARPPDPASFRKRLHRALSSAAQNAFLRLGCIVVPPLSRRSELRLARAFVWLLCRPAFRFHRYATANVELAFGNQLTPNEKAEIVRRSFLNAARVMLDYFWFSRHTAERLARHVENVDPVMKRWVEGDFPGVIVTAHLGNWELAGLAIAESGRRLWSVFKPLGSKAVARRMREFRGAGGQRVIPKDGALRAILKALHARDIVALLLDQHVDVRDGGQYHPFFGLPAAFSGAVGTLAARLRAPVLVAAMVYDESRDVYSMRHVREFTAEQTASMRPDDLTAQIVAAMEEMIRRWPGQWLWMYRRWKRYRPSDDPARYPWYAILDEDPPPPAEAEAKTAPSPDAPPLSTLRAAWFEPDIIAAADPLAPDAAVIADGIREAARRCVSRGRPTRLLVARVPGATFEIAFSSVRRVADISLVGRGAAPGGPAAGHGGTIRRKGAKSAQAALPPFSFGDQAAAFTLDGARDNLRLRFDPPAPGGVIRIRRA